MLWVSDGQYYASTELKVKAGPPFIEISNNSGLIVQRGDSAFVSGYNLSVNTNLNAFGSDIVYKITSLPQYGVILKDDVPVLMFTAQDLQDECIEYRHNNRLVCIRTTKRDLFICRIYFCPYMYTEIKIINVRCYVE